MPAKIRCDTCDEPISTNASKCPHCGERVMTKPMAYVMIGLGALLLPITYTSGTEALAHSAGFLRGVYIGIALLPPIIILLGVGMYQQRTEQLADAQ